MRVTSRTLRRSVLAIGLGALIAASAPVASAGAALPKPIFGCFGPRYFLAFPLCNQVRFSQMQGYNDPATPDNLDKVGVLKIGSPLAPNVLVLNPGTSAGSTYFEPLGEDVVNRTRGLWQVWSVERRENLLEDQSMLNQFKQGQATAQQVFDYYLGFIVNPSITNHVQPVLDDDVPFARGWGMNVEIQDLHKVVQSAAQFGRRVVLGGHSLGGSMTTAYATWDFNGKPGASDLSGLVYIDGGSNPAPVTPEQASQSLQDLQNGTPWLAFGGIPAPFLGIFSALGSCSAIYDPNSPSLGYSFPLLPHNLKPSLPPGEAPTNEAQFGFGVSVPSSPPNLIAAQVHAGHLADSGNPRPWVRDGAITPIQRYAAMLCGKGFQNLDGSAWYHPLRLTIDAGAVADGNPNPAQDVLDVHSIHGSDLPRRLQIYAFGAALGGQGVLDDAQALAQQSGIPASQLTLVNRASTYSHNDPSAASPNNEFLDNLVPVLSRIR